MGPRAGLHIVEKYTDRAIPRQLLSEAAVYFFISPSFQACCHFASSGLQTSIPTATRCPALFYFHNSLPIIHTEQVSVAVTL
jgi:hypothetical protein